MSIGAYTNLIKLLKDRLDAKQVTLGIKTIQIVAKPERLQQDMMPYLLLTPDSQFITEEYGSSMQNQRKNATINLLILCEYPINDRDTANALYDEAGGVYTGFLPFVEKLVDALNTTTGGDLNPQLEDATASMGITVQNVEKTDNSMSFEIALSVTGMAFVINNRQNI